MKTIELLRLHKTPENLTALQAVFHAMPSYFVRISGKIAQVDESEKLFHELPPTKNYEDKYVLGIYSESQLVGCIDFVVGYPNAKTLYLGLLLVPDIASGQGFGRAAFQKLDCRFLARNCNHPPCGSRTKQDRYSILGTYGFYANRRRQALPRPWSGHDSHSYGEITAHLDLLKL